MIFVIEHMDSKMWDWSLLEYAHISSIVGRMNLIFTNIHQGASKLRVHGKVYVEHASAMGFDQTRVCILDSSGKETLQPSDADKFDYFVFGGILGDYPEVGKSLKLLNSMSHARVRNLGTMQMSTDTAVLVAHKILNGIPMEKIRFKDHIELDMGRHESVQLPYRYVVKDGEPILPPGLVDMLKEQKGF